MANKTVGDLNFKVGADASGVVSGLQPAINAWKTYKSAADSALKPGNTAVDATAMASVERERTMLAQITGVSKAGSYDPSRLTAFAQATNHATQAQKQLWSAQIQTKVAANMVAYSLGTNSTGAIGAVSNLGNTTADSLKGFKRFQLGVQNAGYQVQDFFVQVASGQSKLVALAQQLPQLLGPFGMYGALAGVAVSIGAVAYQTLKASSNAEQAASKFKTLKEATDALAESQRQLALIGKDQFAELPFFNSELAKAEDELAKAQDELNKKTETRLRLQKQAEQAGQLGMSESAGAFAMGANANRLSETDKKGIAAAELAVSEAQRKVSELKEKQYQKDRENENSLIDIAVKGVSEKLQADFMRTEELKKLDEFRDKKMQERMDGAVQSIMSEIYGGGNRMATITGLQSRMPESLRVSAGSGFSYGQSVGGSGADILDLTRRMLNALEKLVELERYDLNPI